MVQQEKSVVQQEKSAMRRHQLRLRNGLDVKVRLRGGALLAKKISAIGCVSELGKRVDGELVVASYYPIGSEIAPHAIEQLFRADDAKIALPVVVRRDMPLRFRVWINNDQLVCRGFGGMEPLASAEEVVPNVLLVPLLAFDRHGYRLGYGGGYYDRTLAALRARGRCLTIGLAFSEQEVDAVPREVYDQRLDAVVTPGSVVEFFDLDL